jgi:hypothetical protein
MKRTIVVLMMALLIASCRKEESNPVGSISMQEKVTDYYPLTVGNYWIYKYYTSDSTLNFIDQNIIDSVYVEKDSVSNGKVYADVRSFSSVFATGLLRDSSDYIITDAGKKLFTINQDTNNLIDRYLPSPNGMFHDTWKMKNSDSVCTVPSGQYQAKYLVGTLTSNAPSSPSMAKRNFYYAYVKGIGLVYERLGYLSSPIYLEERLIRYHVNGTTF